MRIVCYLRQGSKVFETYWTTARGVEVMDNTGGRPIAQWPRLEAGRSDDLGATRAREAEHGPRLTYLFSVTRRNSG